MTKLYSDPYTLDGRLNYAPWVTEKKVEWTDNLVRKMMRGDRQAKGLFESLITTSELSANLAHLTNAAVLPQIDDTELVSDQIAGTRDVSDFRTNFLYTLNRQFGAGVTGDGQEDIPHDYLPVVPEATPYPEIRFEGELIEGSEIEKRGAGLGITWEALQNDSVGMVAAIPGLFRTLATNTLEVAVFGALLGATVPAFAGGSSLDGTTVAPNAALSREALQVAVTQLKQQIRASYGEQLRGGINLVVGVGESDLANWLVNSLRLEQIKDGNLVWGVSEGNPLSGVTVVESVYVTSGEWYVLPKKGTTVRPVLDRLRLIGHEAVDLRVENLTGQYVGGGNVHPMEGSFVADTAKWRARQVTKGVLWSPQAVVHSDGSGQA